MFVLTIVALLGFTDPDVSIVVPDRPFGPGRVAKVLTKVDHHGLTPLSLRHRWFAVEKKEVPGPYEPIGNDIEVWPDGSARFGTGLDATKVELIYTISGTYKEAPNEVFQASARIEVKISSRSNPDPPPEPGPPPPPIPPVPIPPGPIPVPTNELGIFVYDKLNNVKLPGAKTYAPQLAVIYKSTAAAIDAGDLKTKDQAVTRIALETRKVLGNDLQAWVDVILQPLREELNRRGYRTKTVQELSQELKDIAAGYAAIK
jgi:hypothetical protein